MGILRTATSGRGTAPRNRSTCISRPDGSEDATAPTNGFILASDGLPSVYVSGDNASVAVADEIAQRRYRIDVAVVHVGAARVPPFGDALLTLDAERAVEATRLAVIL